MHEDGFEAFEDVERKDPLQTMYAVMSLGL
jgi:hypothetical protein